MSGMQIIFLVIIAILTIAFLFASAAAFSNDSSTKFYILSAISIAIILSALFAIKDETPLLFAISSGMIVGSLISIMFMSFISLNSFSLIARPIIFLMQIVLVILVAVKKFGKNDEKRK